MIKTSNHNMTCRHALTDNQFTQVDTNTQTTVIKSIQFITYTEVDGRRKKFICLININDREMTFEKIISLCYFEVNITWNEQCQNSRLHKAFAESRLYNFLYIHSKQKSNIFLNISNVSKVAWDYRAGILECIKQSARMWKRQGGVV